MAPELIPARRVLREAEAENRRLGHENLGFLSETHGFMPSERPRLALPASHRAWDERAAALPEMFRTLSLRHELARMPVLDASTLPENDLYRAAAILGIFAHSFHYVETAPYERVPDSILVPWDVVSQRLRRPAPHLSFIDLNVYNWRLIDPNATDPMRVENLRLLIPIVGNEDERRFQCTPIEMVAGFTPVMMGVVRAQEAAQRDDPAALERELVRITELLNALTFTSFMKVNPNAESPQYVDPVVWGKTVAPLATPFQPGKSIPGPSGTAIPTFTLMDIFFGRTKFATTVGHETERTRAWFPPHWQAFLEAAEQISVPDYVQKKGSAALSGTFHQAMEAYSGEGGMIGRHRLKAYGFLDLSFKAGRSKTLGGFDGGFQDRLWDRMDDQLEYARKERYGRQPESCHFVRIQGVEELSGEGAASVRRVVLDTRGTGIRYQPGDRCAILPENSPELVEKTLRALAATGDEPIPLTPEWRAAVQLRDGYRDSRVLSLRTLLTFGRIRPVTRSAAKVLHAVTHNEVLHRVIEARAEDQWELWDLLEMLSEAGFNPKRLRKAAPGEREHIARLVPPETYRMYSISSVMEGDDADELHLTIGQLSYRTGSGEVSRAETRSGTCSAFLGRMIEAPASGRRISIKIVHPPRFDLPKDPRRPVVMFAGGTGIAPFVGMLEARARQRDGAENWLFYGARTRGELHYASAWQSIAQAGRLHLRSAFSRDDVRARADAGGVRFEPAPRSRIDAEILAPENAERLRALADAGAYFYVCGRTGFAKSVMLAMQKVLGGAAGVSAGREQLYRLVGEDRYLQEIFTTYPGAQYLERKLFDASEVVLRNSAQAGYWMVISGRVYDVTEFSRMHAGGLKIIQSYAGMDATVAYRRAQHDVNPEVDSLTGMFEIGAVRRLDFGSEWGVAVSPTGLRFVGLSDLYEAFVRFTYAVVEMENALQNDHSISSEPVTYDEQRGSVHASPYRLQLRLQSHERFLRDYLSAITGPVVEHLWTVTCGLCSERLDSRWIKQELQSIEAGAAAQHTRSLTWDNVSQRLSLPALSDLAEVLAVEDRRFLDDVKQALRRGLQVFEALQQDTLTQGRRPLVDSLRSLPRLVAEYYTRVSARTQQPRSSD